MFFWEIIFTINMTKTPKPIARCKMVIAKLHFKKQASIGRRLTYKDVALSLNIPHGRLLRVIGGFEKKDEWRKKIAEYYGIAHEKLWC